MNMPYDLIQATHLNNIANHFLVNQSWAGAIHNYELSLTFLENELINSDDARRCRICACIGLADALIKYHNDSISSDVLMQKILKLFEDALKCLNDLDNVFEFDIYNNLNVYFKLALISFGDWPLAPNLKDNYFNIFTVLNYLEKAKDKLSNSNLLITDEFSIFIFQISDMNWKVLQYLVQQYYDELDLNAVDEDDDISQSDQIASLAERCLLNGLELLFTIPSSHRDDNWWRLRLGYYNLAVDVSDMEESELDDDFVQLFLDNFTNINNIIVTDLDSFNDFIVHVLRSLPLPQKDSASDEDKLLQIINAEIIRIKTMVKLLVMQDDQQIISLMYSTIANGFENIHGELIKRYPVDSYAIKMSSLTMECFKSMTRYPDIKFPADQILQLNKEAMLLNSSTLNSKILEVHKLCLTILLALYQRADFPNKQLQYYLQDKNNRCLLNSELVEVNQKEASDTANNLSIIDAEHSADLAVTVVNVIEADRPLTQEQMTDDKKRKSDSCIGKTQFMLMSASASPRSPEHDDKKQRSNVTNNQVEQGSASQFTLGKLG